MTTRDRARIAVVVPGLEDGGGVPAVARFIRDAASRSGEFDLKFVSLAMSASDPSSVRLSRPGTWFRGVRTTEGAWEGSSYTHVGAFATELEFQRYRPRVALTRALAESDLVQVVSGGPSWALSVMGSNKPVVLAVASRTILERRRREVMEEGALANWRRLMTRVTDRLDERALRRSDAVLVMNPSMLEYASEVTAGSGVRVRYGPPGVDTDFFRPKSDRLSNPKVADYILAVGRFDDPRKNVELLLRAFALLRRSVTTPLGLDLVSAADPGPAFRKKVHDLGLTGTVALRLGTSRKALVDLYRHATCLALASDEEGFGIVLTEAMACGVPVVATRCGGPEGVITEGVDGYLVSRGSVRELADRMRRLVVNRDVNERMGQHARRKVLDMFSLESAVAVYFDTYRHLLQTW